MNLIFVRTWSMSNRLNWTFLWLYFRNLRFLRARNIYLCWLWLFWHRKVRLFILFYLNLPLRLLFLLYLLFFLNLFGLICHHVNLDWILLAQPKHLNRSLHVLIIHKGISPVYYCKFFYLIIRLSKTLKRILNLQVNYIKIL